MRLLSAAFEKTAFVLSRRAGAWISLHGVEAVPRIARVGWDVDSI